MKLFYRNDSQFSKAAKCRRKAERKTGLDCRATKHSTFSQKLSSNKIVRSY